MRILVTGANGQVGQELLRALAENAAGNARPTLRAPAAGRPPPAESATGSHPATRTAPSPQPSPPGERETSKQSVAGEGAHPVSQEEDRHAAAGGCAPDVAIIPATRSGHLEGGDACERIDLADRDGLRAALDRIAPDLIVNAAAYTAVDRAEDEEALATRINGDAVGVIGTWAAAHGARVVHYSTDYVFDGAATRPYREDDTPHPIGAYGRSKLAGEIALRDSGARHLLLRTAWVYAARGHNFLRTMLRAGAERDALRVVDDQVGAPTPAWLIANVTAQAIVHWYARDGDEVTLDGTYHLVASGQTNWCGFARAIFERAARAGLLARVPHVAAITTAEYPTPAARPAYSVLDTTRLRRTFAIELPDWQTALDGVIAGMRAAGDAQSRPLA